MEDFNSKYTGQQVEDLLDQVASGNAGGGGGTITEAEIAAMGFTKNEGTITEVKMNGVSKGTSGVIDLGDVPTKDVVDGLMDWQEGADSDISHLYNNKQDSITDLASIREGAAKGATAVQPNDIIDVAHKDDGYVIANGILDEGDHYWHLPNSSSDEEEYTLATKSDIKDEIYIADFTRESLRRALHDGTHVYCDMQALVAAMNANKIILVREGEDSSYKGVYVLNGYAEDFLYFSIVDTSGDILWCEGTDYTSSPYIDSQTLHERNWVDKADRVALSAVATSGNYNDLSNKPTIPSAVTESTVSGWGFTKNTGTYSKPSGGIPKSDLNSTVQTSLNKAESSAQTYIVNFDIWQLLHGEEILDDGGDVLRQAVENHKLILIPLDKAIPAFGYLPMSVYAEDGIYFSVVCDTKIISGVVWDNDQELRVEDVIIEDVSQKQDKIKFETGGLSFITASGLNAENADVNVVLPSDANGEEDDILLTRDSVKTINGESIFGSGDITIEGGGGSSGGGGKEYVVVEPNFSPMGAEINISNIEPNKTYIVSEPIILLHINRFGTTEAVCDEYNVIFKARNGDTVLTIVNVDYLFWVNGTIPTMEEGAVYELSIQRVRISGIDIYNAVLTPFKPVE